MLIPRFSPVDGFKLSVLHVSHSTAQKVYITYRFKSIVPLLLAEQY